MAAHYGVGILPARPRRPRDKAAVEAGVRFAQTYILGRLRNVTFFSLAECNAAIAGAVERMNSREMRRLGMSRRQLFETIERPLMQTLPQDDFEYAEWHLARVGIDYHVEVQSFLYSVPHGLIREQVDTRATARTIEIFHRGKRVATHLRRYGGPRHGTKPEHMPSAHRRYAEWTPERLQRQAQGIGPNTEALIIAVMARRPHPEQGFRTCLGVLRLFRGLDAARVEAVSLRAVEIGALSYASIASILKHRLDRSAPRQAADGTHLLHANIHDPATIKETSVAHSSHARPVTTSDCTEWPKASGIWPTTRESHSVTRSGWAFCSIEHTASAEGFEPRQDRRCPRRRLGMSITEHRADDARCS
jgi:transposase